VVRAPVLRRQKLNSRVLKPNRIALWRPRVVETSAV